MKKIRTLILLILFSLPFNLQAQYFNAPVVNPFGYFDVGTSSRPDVADLDGDGDFDLVVGEFNGSFFIYENTGDSVSPIFTYMGSDTFGLRNIGFSAEPAFYDFDNDGDEDLLAGNYDGDFVLFEDTSLTPVVNQFDSTGINPFSLTPITSRNSTPTLVDIDADGDLDLFSGDSIGNFYFFEDTGIVGAPAFGVIQTNPFGLSAINTYSTADFTDLDGDGDFDCLAGDITGAHIYFENVGSDSVPSFAVPAVNPFNLNDAGSYGNPAFADMDDDGDEDLFVGNSFGSLLYYENIPVPASMSAFDDTIICMNTSLDSVPFTLGGLDTANFQITLTSDDQTLLPNSNLSYVGQYPDFWLVATPATGEAGTVTITVTALDAVDTTSENLTLTIYFEPAIIDHPSDYEICEGETAIFTVVPIAVGFAIQWFHNGNAINGANQETVFIPNTSSADAGVYTVEISGLCGSPVTSQPATLTVNAIPVVSVQPDTVTLFEGDTLELTASSQGNPTWQWYYNANPISGTTSETFIINDISVLESGTYVCEATSQEGCVGYSNVALVTVEPFSGMDYYPVTSHIEVSPNPLAHVIYVKSEGISPYNSKLELVNLQGVLLNSFPVSSPFQKIEVGELAAGVYLLRVTDSDMTPLKLVVE